MHLKIIRMALLLLLLTVPAHAEPRVIKLSSPTDLEDSLAPAKRYLGKLIEERSGGRIRVEMTTHPRVESTGHLQRLLESQVELSLCSIELLSDHLPLLDLFELPFLFQGRQHLYAVLESKLSEKIFITTEASGFQALALWDRGFRQLLAAQPLPSALQGKALRLTAGGRLTSEPVPQPAAEQASRAKILDVELQELSQLPDIEHYSDLSLSGHAVSGELLLANQSFWQQLPRDLQVIIASAIEDATRYARELSLQQEEEQLKSIATAGRLHIHLVPPAQRAQWRQQLRTQKQLGSKSSAAFEHLTELIRNIDYR